MKYLKHELSQEIEVLNLSLAEVYEIHIYMIHSHSQE